MNHPAAVALYVTRRVQALEGETRLNLLRLAAVACFYGAHLVNRYLLGMSAGSSLGFFGIELPIFDVVALSVSIAWAGFSGAMLLLVRTRLYRPFMAVAMTLVDLGLLTTLLLLGNGVASPLVFAYFVLIMGAVIRGTSRAVWVATLGALIGYVLLLVLAREGHTVPPYHLLVTSVAIFFAGVAADQAVTMAQRSALLHADVRDRVRSLAGDALEAPPRAGDACPFCLSAVAVEDTRCWRCHQPLDAGGEFVTASARPWMQRGPVHLGWAASVVLLVVVLVGLAIGLLTTAPALLVPFAAVSVLVVIGLGRILQSDLARARAQGAPSTVSVVATGVVGVTGVILVSGLLAAAGVVVLLALCTTMIVFGSA